MGSDATHRADQVSRPDPCERAGDLSRRVAELPSGPDLYKYSGDRERGTDLYKYSGDREQANRFLPPCSIGGVDAPTDKRPVEAQRSPENKGAAATLFDGNSSPQQQLAAVRELSKLGISNLTMQGKDGQSYSLRLEREPAGSREMVHLHMTGPDGKERVVLRGIANQDGSFTQERGRSGQPVDWYGSAGAKFKAINPNDSTRSDPSNDMQPPYRDQQPPYRDQPPPYRDQPPPYRPRPSDDLRPPFRAPEVPVGAIDRSQFDAQLNDPRVMAAFAGRMSSEVGSQGPAAQVAFAEEVMNRAMARNQTLMQALTGNYYPTHNPGSSHNPALVEAITKAWKEGTDTIYGATGNASGTVGFGVRGGHYDANHRWVSPNQTVNINGERFGYEQVDISKGWLKKYEQLKTGSPVR